MFLVILKYENGLKIVDENVEAHREYLDKYYSLGKFICSGAQVPRTGGVILCNADNREELDQIIMEDPFYINKAAKHEVIEFNASKYKAGFEAFIK